MDGEALASWVMSCQKENGGFGSSPRNDPHLLFTLSAIQILAILDKMDLLDNNKVLEYISSLQVSHLDDLSKVVLFRIQMDPLLVMHGVK